MTSTELEHLIKMINQIADNVTTSESDEVRAQNVAAHLKRFWAPSMRTTLRSYAGTDGDLLQPIAQRAVELLSIETQA